jgi:hypothetical protein
MAMPIRVVETTKNETEEEFLLLLLVPNYYCPARLLEDDIYVVFGWYCSQYRADGCLHPPLVRVHRMEWVVKRVMSLVVVNLRYLLLEVHHPLILLMQTLVHLQKEEVVDVMDEGFE